MDVPRRPGDVLAQPTRARLFAALAELRRPVGTGELAERIGLHPNGVRAHLERLLEAGLVERERERRPRGRPRDSWTVSPAARPGGEPPTAYADLSRWLARAIAAPAAGIEATGREIGRELAPREPAPAATPARLEAIMVALGFRPACAVAADGTATFRLGNCPYRDAVRDQQGVVCDLHRGITRGLLDVLDPACELAAFVPHDPDTAGCEVVVRRS
jgi:predicted ArsR family transcriptional regulator